MTSWSAASRERSGLMAALRETRCGGGGRAKMPRCRRSTVPIQGRPKTSVPGIRASEHVRQTSPSPPSVSAQAERPSVHCPANSRQLALSALGGTESILVRPSESNVSIKSWSGLRRECEGWVGEYRKVQKQREMPSPSPKAKNTCWCFLLYARRGCVRPLACFRCLQWRSQRVYACVPTARGVLTSSPAPSPRHPRRPTRPSRTPPPSRRPRSRPQRARPPSARSQPCCLPRVRR